MKRIIYILLVFTAIAFNSTQSVAWPTPVLLAPLNGAQTWAGINLDWAAINNSQQYQMQLDTSPNFNSPVMFSVVNIYINSSSSNTDTEHFADDLFFGQVYHWRVRAYVAGDTSSWAQQMFTTRDFVVTNAPPTGSSNWTGLTLDWLTHTGVDFYDMEADTVDTFNSPAYRTASKTYINANSANTDTQHFLDDLYFGVTYFWRVRARNAVDTTTWSAYRTFDTRDFVTLVSPADAQANVNATGVTLNWDAHSGIDVYQLQLDSSASFNSTILVSVNKNYINTNNNNSDTQHATGALLANTNYFWRVRAINAVDTSSWTTWSFSTSNCANPGIISGSNAVCQNSTIDYSVAPVGGATSYNWSIPSGWTGTSTTNTITVTAGNAGGTISVTVNNPCGISLPQNLNVSVDSLLGAMGTLTGPSVACEGALASYFIPAVPGATNYTWTLPSGWAGSTNTNNMLTTVGNTSGSITVTATNACDTSSTQMVSTNVEMLPGQPVSIVGSLDVCNGSANAYSINPVAGATHYAWVLPNGWSGSSIWLDINTIASSSSGLVTVAAQNACGSSIPQTISVNVNVVDTSVTINGLMITSNEPGATYQWLDCDNNFAPITNATSQSFIVPASGNYAVAILSNGCADTSACQLIVLVGVENLNTDNTFLIFPNPSNGNMTVHTDMGNVLKTLTIADVNGRVIYNSGKFLQESFKVELNAAPGVYFATITSEQKIRTVKLVIR